MQDVRVSVGQVVVVNEKDFENTIYVAAKEVRALRSRCSDEYADAILDQNGYGSDTAEIYFYLFAPKGFPRPNWKNPKPYLALMNNPERRKEYDVACFNGWREEIQRVQQIVKRYGGAIEVDGTALESYLNATQTSGETPVHRVHVKVSLPEQRQLRLVRKIRAEIPSILREKVEEAQVV